MRALLVVSFAVCILAGLTAQADWSTPAVRVPASLRSTTTATNSTQRAPWAWYEASSETNFTFDASGNVMAWLDRGAHKHNATAYTISGRSAAYGTYGVTNGIPAYLMGEHGSNVDLKFVACADIRTVFWVVDISRRGFLLASTTDANYGYDFHRCGADMIKGSDPYDYGLFNSSSKFWTGSEIRLDGRTVAPDVPVKPGATHLISARAGVNTYANCFSNDRNISGNGNRTGGRALSELIIFNRVLTTNEFVEIENYLAVKWFNATSNIVTTVDLGTGVVYPNLCVGEGGSFTCSPASFVPGSPAIDVMGTLSKTANKIVITWTGAKPTSCSAYLLRAGAAPSLTLDDFDCSGFPVGTKFFWTGTELTAVFPGVDRLPAALTTQDTTKAPWAWYEASSETNFTFDASGNVTAWLDRGAQKHNATAYTISGRTAAYGTYGMTNGLPAYLMGELGNNVDLQFAACSTIRTVFWVMDISISGFLLADKRDGMTYDFHRGDDKLFNKTYAPKFVNGEVRLDGQTVSYDTSVLPGATHLITARASSDAYANCLSNDRCIASPNRTGGRALSELIIFNRVLTTNEFAEVENYLAAKWFNVTSNIVTAVDVGAGVIYPNLCVGEGASFTCSRASIAAGTPAIDVMGTLSKTANKIVITWSGVKPTKCSTCTLLACAAADSLTREDFDCQGFPADTTILWTGTELTASFPGTDLLPTALTTEDTTKAPWAWYEASSETNFTFDASGNVTAWLDRGAQKHNATAYTISGRAAAYGTYGVTNGLPAYLMGEFGNNVDLKFTSCGNIRTIFWVVDIARRGFLLSHNDSKFDFHRNASDSITGIDENDYGLFSQKYATQFWTNSVIRLDGQTAAPNVPVKPGATHLIAACASGNTSANCFSNDRNLTGGGNRTGGRALSELIIFNRVLSTNEFAEVENYLGAKWFDATTNLVAATTVPAEGLSYPNLTIDDGGSFAVNAANVRKDVPFVKVYGALQKGTAEKIQISWTGGLRRAILLQCAASEGLTVDDFELTGDVSGVKLEWDGTTLRTPKQGLMVIFR